MLVQSALLGLSGILVLSCKAVVSYPLARFALPVVSLY